MNYIESRLQNVEEFLKDLKMTISDDMVEFDCTIFTCKIIIMNIEEIIRIAEEKRMIKSLKDLNEKAPF